MNIVKDVPSDVRLHDIVLDMSINMRLHEYGYGYA